MVEQPRRGTIYWVDFDPVVGSEQGSRRPAVVVSNDTGNRYGSVVTVVPLTSKLPSKAYPHVVVLPPTKRRETASAALCAQLRTVSKERLEDILDWVPSAQMDQIDDALRVVLSL